MRRVFALLLLLQAPALVAQQDSSKLASPRACTLGTISYVFVDNHSIVDTNTETTSKRFGWFYRTANALHIRTRRSVIARELLFAPGDCYDPWLIEESERLLRSNPFLAQVDIFGVPQPDGTYHVLVNTRDEWSTQAEVRFAFRSGPDFEGVRVRETNLLGRGVTLGAYYITRDVTRDYGVSYFTPQLAGTRWDLEAELGATRAGTTFSQSLAYPFVGDVSRWSSRQEFSREDRFFDYVAGEQNDHIVHVLMPLRDKHFDFAVVTRLGHRGNLTLIGGGLTYAQLTYPGTPEIGFRREFFKPVTPADSALVQPSLALHEDLSSIRLSLLLGQRRLAWVKRRGLDALRGQQDVRLGVEAGLAVARSLPALEADNDLVNTFALYTGLELGSVIVATRSRLDARFNFDAPANVSGWEDVYGESELLAYWRPPQARRHTVVVRAAGTAGWNTVTPFQLTLGGDRNLRGFRPDRFPGGRRMVFTGEHRLYWGWPRPGTLDVGHTLFADVGRMWPGDVPYGKDSDWLVTVGAGLRAAFPAGSRTTYRVDFALPVQSHANPRDFRVMISVGELVGLSTLFGDPQLSRSRYEGITGQLFRFRP